METGTLTERRTASADDALGERQPASADDALVHARGIIEEASLRLAALTAALREAHDAQGPGDLSATGGASGAGDHAHVDGASGSTASLSTADAASGLARLDVARRDLEDALHYLEVGVHSRVGHAAARAAVEVQERERARLAEELHDGPAQALSNATFQVEVIGLAMRSDPETASRELLSLRLQLERELDRLRGYIHQLRPALEEEGGLDAALAELATTTEDETGIAVRLELTAPEEALALEARTAVLRVAQEALRNVRKHARARAVRIITRLEPIPGKRRAKARLWVLEVRDDGRGFAGTTAPEPRPGRHFGLRFMRERAHSVGGSLHIEGKPDAGTTVRLVLEPSKRS